MNSNMKNSGIEWVGNIPSNWDCKPIRSLFHENRNKNIRGTETKALQFKFGTIVPKENFEAENDEYVAKTIHNYNIVDKGTIMLNGLNLNFDFVTKRVAIVQERGVITSAYIAFEVNDENEVLPEYANYLLKCYDSCAAFHNMGGGVRKILNFAELKRCLFLVPPHSIQEQIVAFLNIKCQQMDELSDEIVKQIEVLDNYRRSLITEIVTRGLCQDITKKDSGIEYIGEIPAHWNIHPLYVYFGERKNKNRLGRESNLLSLSYGKLVRKDINTNEGLLPESFNTYNIIEAGDIIIRPTDLQNDKRSLRTGLATEHGIITSAYIDLMPIKQISTAYFHYLLHAFDVMKVFYNMGNGVRQGLNFSEFSRLMVFEPPIDEQNAIVNFLDSKCSEIDQVIADKKEQLEKIEEYKKSLIYEYVTGKKEVPVA
jgi:type I restriction enzyme S subunit